MKKLKNGLLFLLYLLPAFLVQAQSRLEQVPAPAQLAKYPVTVKQNN